MEMEERTTNLGRGPVAEGPADGGHGSALPPLPPFGSRRKPPMIGKAPHPSKRGWRRDLASNGAGAAAFRFYGLPVRATVSSISSK